MRLSFAHGGFSPLRSFLQFATSRRATTPSRLTNLDADEAKKPSSSQVQATMSGTPHPNKSLMCSPIPRLTLPSQPSASVHRGSASRVADLRRAAAEPRQSQVEVAQSAEAEDAERLQAPAQSEQFQAQAETVRATFRNGEEGDGFG